MHASVIGGSGAFPAGGIACSGYLVEHEGYRLLIDPGYGVATNLSLNPGALDAVYISHGHVDHYADVHALLRTRVLARDSPPLDLYSPPNSLDRILAVDGLDELSDAYTLHEFQPGEEFDIGPFDARTWLLPHFVPNAGIRLEADDRVLAYTGDSGPSPELRPLAEAADVLISEATFPETTPSRFEGHLSTAAEAGALAAAADAKHLVLTHLWPGTDTAEALEAAHRTYEGFALVARPGLNIELDNPRRLSAS